MVIFVLLDDEPDWLTIVQNLIESALKSVPDLIIKCFTNPDDAYEYIINNTIDCLIADYLIPDHITGLDLYYKVHNEKSLFKFFLISNSKIPQDRIKEIASKNIIYLPKSYLVVKNFINKHLEGFLS